MQLKPGLAGRTYAPTPPYTVSKAKIAEFNAAIGAEPVNGGETAPVTFPIVIAFGAMTQLMNDPELGIELHNVIHGDQRFEQVRPIRAGDELVATLTIDALRTAAGMDMIATRTQIATIHGEPVATSFATLVHKAAA
ncbi:MAG: FAS1-like dehydratase domain-containing protein [Nocardioidaceae bacterium]